jgi:hypothetical protein
MKAELKELDKYLDPAKNLITLDDLKKVNIRGAALSSGAAVVGNWSHAKLFSVLNGVDQSQSIATLGGQNHWPDYWANNRPFDSTIMLRGDWARAPSYALDGAIRVFRENQGDPRYYIYHPSSLGGPKMRKHLTDDMNIGAKAFFRARHNIATHLANPATDVIAEFDMGNYSRANTDRIIHFGLGEVTKIQKPWMGHTIFSWAQDYCFLSTGNCGSEYRERHTFVRSFAEVAVNPAGPGAPKEGMRLLMAGINEDLSKYRGSRPKDVLAAFQSNAARTACVGPRQVIFATVARHNVDSPAIDYTPIKQGNEWCHQAAYRELLSRSEMRTAQARDQYGKLVPAGQHHKIFIFDNATFVGSFNPYPSSNTARLPLTAATPDSQLIENGLWFFDAATRRSVLDRANEAWSIAQKQW